MFVRANIDVIPVSKTKQNDHKKMHAPMNSLGPLGMRCVEKSAWNGNVHLTASKSYGIASPRALDA
jgi:hypothetical protein